MKNKKIVKTATLLSSLMGLALISSSLSSSIISFKQNDTVKSDVNNEVNASSYENTAPTNSDWYAWAFFEDNSTVNGRLTYTLDETTKALTITGYSDDFSITNGKLREIVPIAEENYTLTTIGASAFKKCSGLNGELTLSGGITTIESSAFYGCNNLTKVNLSKADKLTTIGDGAFTDCPISKIEINPSNTNFSLVSNNGDKGHILVSGSGLEEWDGTAPAVGCLAYGEISYNGLSVSGTGDTTFASSNITLVDFGESITTIGQYAFGDCENLNYVYIPANVSSIGEGAFYGCIGLTSLDFTSATSLNEINAYAFKACTGLTSLDFTNNNINFGTSAFKDCTNLGSIYFGDNAPTVSSEKALPFSGCNSLINVFIPEAKLFDTSYLTESDFTSLGLNIDKNYIVAKAGLEYCVNDPENISGTAKLRRTSFGNESTLPTVVLNDIGDISLSNENTLNLSNQSSNSNSITGIDTNAFFDSDASIQSVKLGTQITTIQENAFTDADIKNIDLSDWTAAEFEKLVDSGEISKDWLGNLKYKHPISITVSADQIAEFNNIASEIGIDGCTITDTYPIPTQESSDKDLALGLGLGLGLGVPAVAGATGGTVYGVKKHKIKKQ